MEKISIIIPLYNKAQYIEDTIQSVLSQTYCEMLVVDNGSTDGGWEKVQQIHEPRIHLLQSPKRGPGAARNYGLSYAQGKWVQFLDADDLLEPDHLEKQLTALQKNPEADIIASCWQEFTDENPKEKILKQPAGMGQPIQFLWDYTIAFAPWAVHAALIKRSILSTDCYWPEELDHYLGEDIAFWFKLINQCTEIIYSESEGALYRVKTTQCRNQNSNPEKWFEGVHASIQLNQKFWQSRKQFYTPGQCENLMRVYLQISLLASKRKSLNIQKQTLLIASIWLKKYFIVVKKPKLTMLVRRLAGLHIFLKLTQVFGSVF
jgi:glycosyltransferase involved in cell wall biosynthesis